ncbi:MAG: acyl-CoA dehydrogenase [Bacteroidota bacterium]
MADQYMSMNNLRFVLNEVHHLEEILQHERFEDFDKDSVDILLDAAKDLADKEMFPYFQEFDENPVVFKDGKIIVHPQIGRIIQQGAENGWIGSHFNYEDGGIQMPMSVFCAGSHIFEAANNSATGYLGLTTGAANLIVSFASQELKDRYVPKMLEGKWMGTMALTEPQAGSSLSDLVTSAKPMDNGAYLIDGQKIFISGGDHEYAENFVHLTLARIEGAPEGTKGISLFIVPKKRPTADGGLEDNDVLTAADFQKVGQRGYATTHLVYGENDNCQGWLVGEAGKGLRYMFQMMNGARIDVGLTAASAATAAYYASLQYAKERPQGRPINNKGRKDVNQEPILIINHPDVRRMLLFQRAITEGSISLLFECTRHEDLCLVTEGETSENHHLLLELLTPIAKTYPSEMGLLSISNGLQVLGGYGFCMDFPLQQYYRDIRIMSIYEGTTGIQSIDLLGRKMTMNNGKAVQLLMAEIQKTIEASMTYDELKPYASKLIEKLTLTQKVLQYLMGFAVKGEYERFLADATIFMQFASTLVIAWQWLKMGVAAKQAQVTGQMPYGEEFYEAKLVTMRFYFRYELPKMSGMADTIMDPEVLTLAREREFI